MTEDILKFYDFKKSYETFEEHKVCKIFEDIVHKIVNRYFLFLLEICEHIHTFPSSKVLGKNKFAEVSESLFQFLYAHKHFVKLEKIILEGDKSNKKKIIRVCYLENAFKFLNYDYLLKFISKYNNDDKNSFSVFFKFSYNRKNTLKALNDLFKVEVVEVENMVNFREKCFIGERNSLNSHIVSYKQVLQDIEYNYLNYLRNTRVVRSLLLVIKTYTKYLAYITLKIKPNSDDFSINLRKFEEVTKELYEFSIKHKKYHKNKRYLCYPPYKN